MIATGEPTKEPEDDSKKGAAPPTRVISAKSCFVDNLPSTMTAERFRELFEPFAKQGTISLKFLKHRTGSETGYGFVEFSTEADGKSAISQLNGRIIEGHSIRVTKARPPKQALSETNLYVEGCPQNWTDSDLREKFEPFGTVEQTRILVNRRADSGQQKSCGVGFVHFTAKEEAAKALQEMNGSVQNCPDGSRRVLKVKFAKVPKPRGRGENSGGPAGWGPAAAAAAAGGLAAFGGGGAGWAGFGGLKGAAWATRPRAHPYFSRALRPPWGGNAFSHGWGGGWGGPPQMGGVLPIHPFSPLCFW